MGDGSANDSFHAPSRTARRLPATAGATGDFRLWPHGRYRWEGDLSVRVNTFRNRDSTFVPQLSAESGLESSVEADSMPVFTPKFVLLLLLTTLALFLFPAARGSFTATHGPTTALRAANYLRNLLVGIAGWAALLAAMVHFAGGVGRQIKSESPRLSFSALPLRC